MISPPFLKKGDKIAITCPAKSLPGPINSAVEMLEGWGLEVVLGETVFASHHQYAGTDDLRRRDFQKFLEDESVKAIIAARGGYGAIRVIDDLNFDSFSERPKWIVGFSDITVFHNHIHACCKVQTIHGQMPLNVPDATKPSLISLKKALFGEEISYKVPGSNYNRQGNASGVLIGGNLTLLVTTAGSVSDPDYSGKILFIEDVGEHLYSIDRMMWAMKRSGKLADLAGLVVGGFTSLKDNDIAFGQTVEEIILEKVAAYNYPVCFNFPAGHISDNHALILGKSVTLDVKSQFAELHF